MARFERAEGKRVAAAVLILFGGAALVNMAALGYAAANL
jgi:hypothetical protein